MSMIYYKADIGEGRGAKSEVKECTADDIDEVLEYHNYSGVHEMITGPCKPYFDLDKEFEDEKSYKAAHQPMLRFAKACIGRKYRGSTVIVFDSSGRKGDNWKVSGHFLVSGAGYWKSAKHIQKVAKELRADLPDLDLSVYSKNHLMRMPYTSKPQSDRVLKRALISDDRIQILDAADCVSGDYDIVETYADWLITNVDEEDLIEEEDDEEEEAKPKTAVAKDEKFVAMTIEEIDATLACLSQERLDDYHQCRNCVWGLQDIAQRQGQVDEVAACLRRWLAKRNGSIAKFEKLYDAAGRKEGGIGWRSLLNWALKDSPEAAIAKRLKELLFPKQATDFKNFTFPVTAEFDFEVIRKAADDVTKENYSAFVQAMVEYMNRFHILIKATDKPFIIFNDFVTEDGERKLKREYMRIPAMRVAFANKTLKIDLGEKEKTKFEPLDVWLKHPNRNEKARLIFQPRVLEDPVKYADPTAFNLYDGPGISREQCKDAPQLTEDNPVLQHLKKRWCSNNQGLYDYLLNVMALQVQKPWVKHRAAQIARAPEGAGKTLVFNKLARVVGEKYVAYPTSSEDILGQFNGAIEGKLLIYADEMVWGGDKQREGVLKKLTSEERSMINRKGLDQYPIHNPSNLWMTSNEDWVVAAGAMARRWATYEVSDELAGRKTPEIKKIIDDILAVSDLSFARFLYERDVSDFDPTAIINTEMLRQQKILSLNPIQKVCLSMLESGTLTLNGIRHTVSEAEFVKSCIFDSYSKELKYSTETSFWLDLQRIFPSLKRKMAEDRAANKHRKTVAGKRVMVVHFPKIEELRDNWRRQFNDDEWEFDDADSEASDEE